MTRPTRLKVLRAERDLTQMQLAALAGVQVSTVARLEKGKHPNPHGRTLVRIARALDVSVDDLFTKPAA